MKSQAWHAGLRILSWVVVAAMIGAIGYAGGITVVHWSGIGV